MSPIRISGKGKALAVLSVLVLSVIILTGVQTTSGESFVHTLTLKPESGTFTVDGAIIDEDGNYSCTQGEIVTIRYERGTNVSCVSEWNYPQDGLKIIKETAFVLMVSLVADVEIKPVLVTENVKVASTWGEMVSYGKDASVSIIIVDTDDDLVEMTTTQMVINHDLEIVGDNTSGTNGFIRKEATKSGNIVVPTISIPAPDGNTITERINVSISGVTLDGGAKWKNTSDSDIHRLIQITLQRGDDNSGVSTDKPFISNNGSLKLMDDLIIQNAYNTYTSPDSESNGGALYSGWNVEFDGVFIKDCYAIRGAAAYCIMSSETLTIKGNTIITHNGGLNCQLGSAIYVKGGGTIKIESGKINENYGSYPFSPETGVIMNGGEIRGNVCKAADSSNCNGQDTYCGVFYMWGKASFEMNGGYIIENRTYLTNGVGLYSGIVFQNSGSLTMNGGTICDNTVHKSFQISDNEIIWSAGTSCDVKFGANGGSTGTVDMNGGSLESVINGSSTMTIKSIQVKNGDADVGSGVVIDHLSIVWGCIDMVTDSSGKVYVISDVENIVATAKTLIKLEGVPVIVGNPVADQTLKVELSQTTMYTCKWYIVDPDDSSVSLVSNHTTYVVKSDDFGKRIYVVLKGTNGYEGELRSSSIDICVQFTIYYKDVDDGSVIKTKVFNYPKNGAITLENELSAEAGVHFIGWKSTVNGNTYRSESSYDPSPFIETIRSDTMVAQWTTDEIDVYWIDDVKKDDIELSGFITYYIPEAPKGMIFAGWSDGSTQYATGQKLDTINGVRHFHAVFIDETYHGRLEIGSTTPST